MLTCNLGEAVPTFTDAQLAALGKCVRRLSEEEFGDRELTAADLISLGIHPKQGERILRLLDREALLEQYLRLATRMDCVPVTVRSEWYPKMLKCRLGEQAPSVLFCKGDLRLLNFSGIALVGSRHLTEDGRHFAERIGELAAREGYVLVSGGAYGADQTAQEACLRSGGAVLVFTPDQLRKCPLQARVLYCSEAGMDLSFTNQRALSRNRLIHAFGKMTFVAQCDGEHGGTWQGSLANLKSCWSPLFVNESGGNGARSLIAMGGVPVGELNSLSQAEVPQTSFF